MIEIQIQRSAPEGHAEKLLLAAVIRRAAYDIALYQESPNLRFKRIWEDAKRWMFDDRVDYFTAFVNVCYLLDQDPQTIRQKTLKLTKKDVRKYDMIDPHGHVHG